MTDAAHAPPSQSPHKTSTLRPPRRSGFPRTKSVKGLIEVSTRGLPQHFVGKRNAKTVLVMLNPGQDADRANRNFRCATIDYCRKSAKTLGPMR